MIWVIRCLLLFVTFLIFDVIAYRIDNEKGKKIGWFGWFCFLIDQLYGMFPWESFFK